jgi:opacity protein-like surface antigen
VGFTLGVGLEHMLGSTVGVKAEYRYYHFDDIDFDSKSVDPTPDADLDMHTFMLGLNWHF